MSGGGAGVPPGWSPKKVLVLYAGGTIGMTKNEDGVLAPEAGAMLRFLRRQPVLNDQSALPYCLPADTLAIPTGCRDNPVVLYSIRQYEPLLDSSNMTPDDWSRLAKDIGDNYDEYDGFVVLHGTDTLAYTASALAFMLENLAKPVVLTGSQIPIFEPRTDGRDNVQCSLLAAGGALFRGDRQLSEVAVCFGDRLLRGCRTTELATETFPAFDSPNCRPLAFIGLRATLFDESTHTAPSGAFRVQTALNKNVGVLCFYPSITVETVEAFLSPLQGAVLVTYGMGNVPSNQKPLLEALAAASARGVILLNITAVLQGRVAALYETGAALAGTGAVCGADMTAEAALTKLCYVLAKECDLETKKKMLQENLRGELSPEDC